MTLIVIYYIVLLLVEACALALNIFSLPGNWIMLLAITGYAWATHWQYVGWKWLLILLIIAGVAEALEFFAAGKGAKKAGGTLWGTVGALVGAVLGGVLLSIPIPVIGTLIGILIGTFAGAMTAEMVTGQDPGRSMLIGYGAAKGRLVGTLLKLGFGCMILVLSMVAAFP